MILDVTGSASELVTKRIPMKERLSTDYYVRLNYLHLPDLPLLDEEKDAFEVAGSGVWDTVSAVSSVEELVNLLDGFMYNNVRVFYAWYSDNELEICTGANAVTLSPTFSALLKMPAALTANTCYSSSIFPRQISQYSHYAVRVGSARGEWDGAAFNEFIAKVRRDGEGWNKIHKHYFRRAVDTVDVAVFAVKKDGTILPYTSPDIWAIGLEIA